LIVSTAPLGQQLKGKPMNKINREKLRVAIDKSYDRSRKLSPQNELLIHQAASLLLEITAPDFGDYDQPHVLLDDMAKAGFSALGQYHVSLFPYAFRAMIGELIDKNPCDTPLDEL